MPATPRASTPVVRAQRADDVEIVRDVVTAAFADRGQEVADLVTALERRPGGASYVAELDGLVVGHVHLSWSWLDAPDRVVDVLVLSPLSVAPQVQRRGCGRALVERAITEAAALGAPLLFLEGDPAYYSRFGFEPASPLGLTAPSVRIPPPGFQVVTLPSYDPSMTGALVYADTFWALDCVGLRGADLERMGGPVRPGG